MDPEVFKELVQKEVKRIQEELIELPKYFRSMNVRRVTLTLHYTI